MTTYTKRPPIFDVFEGSGSNQTLIGTIQQVEGSVPPVFQFLPVGTEPLASPAVLRNVANRLEQLNANPPT